MIVEEKKAAEFFCHYPEKMGCEGSSCMAWRWAKEATTRSVDVDGTIIDNAVDSSTHGYCGLAGRP